MKLGTLPGFCSSSVKIRCVVASRLVEHGIRVEDRQQIVSLASENIRQTFFIHTTLKSRGMSATLTVTPHIKFHKHHHLRGNHPMLVELPVQKRD